MRSTHVGQTLSMAQHTYTQQLEKLGHEAHVVSHEGFRRQVDPSFGSLIASPESLPKNQKKNMRKHKWCKCIYDSTIDGLDCKSR
jgi:hypothetical protein